MVAFADDAAIAQGTMQPTTQQAAAHRRARCDDHAWPEALVSRTGARRRPPWLFDADTGRRQLLQFFAVHDLTGFGIDERPRAIAAAGALLGYVEETQKQRLPHLSSIAVEASDGAIAMNAVSYTHLTLPTILLV